MDSLLLLLLLPFAGAVVVFLLPRRLAHRTRQVAALFSGLALVYALSLLRHFSLDEPGTQLLAQTEWNHELGTSLAIGIDGFSYPLILLTTLLTLLAIGVSGRITERPQTYFMLVLALESATLGVFVAQDWALFYVFWELVLIPLFFLLDRWGDQQRQTAALNFVLYTMGGSVFMLLSLLVLFDANPAHSFLFDSMRASAQLLPASEQLLIFLGLLIGFGVKMSLFPLHGWLPLADVEAPNPVAILLSGVLLKMGAYGLIRSSTMLPDAALQLQDWLLLIGLTGLIYGGLLAWRQDDLKKVIAYASISHMGLVLVGIASLNRNGMLGAMTQMIAHGLTAAALFMLAGLLYERTGTRDLRRYGCMISTTPRFALFFVLAFAGTIGLPGTAAFPGEIHTLIGGFERWQWLIALLAPGILIAATYSLRPLKQLYTGNPNPAMAQLADLNLSETLAAGTLVIGIVLLGLYPYPLTALMDSSVSHFAASLPVPEAAHGD
ncbi:MAG: NADH-quinone oxidoreductase subunit M [Thiothrix sp.]|nr:NADH-quinone oxidoreductase subunit M [Thiothrix sp.]HPQ95231.1 NADH-quinone oxidoreductase subunit M [Thiolinea sp.]